MRSRLLLLFLVAPLAGCHEIAGYPAAKSPPPHDGGLDAHHDAAMDSARDQGSRDLDQDTRLDDGPAPADGHDDAANPAPPPICSTGGWCWSNPTPQGNQLNDVWAATAHTIVAVGARGTALHLENGVWTLKKTEVTVALHGVWGASATAVHAVGDGGTLLHYDGQRWATKASPTAEALKAVWGSGASEVYAVGYSGSLLTYDGHTWSPSGSGTSANLVAVWGHTDGLVVAGTGGTLRRRVKGVWSSNDCQTGYTLTGIWGTSLSDLWLTSAEGIVYRVRGDVCAREYVTDGSFLQAVTGSGEHDITVGGRSGRYHYDGTTWSKTSENQLYGVASISAGHAFAVGADGLLATWQAGAWSGDDQHLSASLIAASAAGDDLYAAHTRGAFHHDATGWAPDLDWNNLVTLAVWGQSATEVYFAGRGLGPLRFDGTQLEQLPTPSFAVFLSAWGNAQGLVFFGDANGTVHRYAGTEWSLLPTGAVAPIAGLWGTSQGELYAATVGGEIRHYDGGSWRLVAATSDSTPLASIWANDNGRVIAVGEQGVVLEGKAGTWSQSTLGEGAALTAVVGRGSEAFATGESGEIFHSDGTRWEAMESGTSHALRGACLGADGRVYVVGRGGTVLYHQ